MRFLSALQSRSRRAARAERVSLQVLQRRKIAGEQCVALSGAHSLNPLLAVSAKYLDLNCHTYNTPPLEQYWFEWRVTEFLSAGPLLPQLSASTQLCCNITPDSGQLSWLRSAGAVLAQRGCRTAVFIERGGVEWSAPLQAAAAESGWSILSS